MTGRSPTQFVGGVAGFIGSTAAEQLLARGHREIGVDSLNELIDIVGNVIGSPVESVGVDR